jgi:DNA-binding response OmpR family regulator
MAARWEAGHARFMARLTVLVVDDDRDLCEALRDLLSVEGFEPICVGDGAAALAYLRDAPPPCLVLLDLTLPKIDGVRVREALRRDSRLRSIPVVILSARTDTALAARRLGAGYLTKPFEVGMLLDTLRRYAASSRAAR